MDNRMTVEMKKVRLSKCTCFFFILMRDIIVIAIVNGLDLNL